MQANNPRQHLVSVWMGWRSDFGWQSEKGLCDFVWSELRTNGTNQWSMDLLCYSIKPTCQGSGSLQVFSRSWWWESLPGWPSDSVGWPQPDNHNTIQWAGESVWGQDHQNEGGEVSTTKTREEHSAVASCQHYLILTWAMWNFQFTASCDYSIHTVDWLAVAKVKWKFRCVKFLRK